MNIQIYDMSVKPDDIVIVAGDMSEETREHFKTVARMVNNSFNNPVLFIPDSMAIDSLDHEKAVNMVLDSLAHEDILKLLNIVEEAFERSLPI